MTTDELDLFQQLHAEGYTPGAIAQVLSRTVTYVNKVHDRMGLVPNPVHVPNWRPVPDLVTNTNWQSLSRTPKGQFAKAGED